MFRFVHAADIHLDSPLRGLEAYEDAPVEQIRGAARRAFDNLISLAVEEDAAFVVLAGDLYDGDWKDYNTGLYFMRRMGRLREAGIPVFVVSGNHDAASQLTRTLTLPDNVTMFSHKRPQTARLDALGVAIHGQSYAARTESENFSARYPPAEPGLFNIGLLHTGLNGRPGHDPYAPCTLENLLAKGYDYWALGHVHQREIVHVDPWVVFPGNIQGRHMREVGPRGCTLVTVDDGRISAVEHRDLDVLRFAWCGVDLGGCASVADMCRLARERMEDALREADGRPLVVRVELRGRTPLHARLYRDMESVRQEVRGVAAVLGEVWLEKLVLATEPEHSGGGALSAPEGISLDMQAVSDVAELLDMIPDLRALRAKLPVELRGDEDPFAMDGDGLEQLRAEVREMLAARLQGVGHED